MYINTINAVHNDEMFPKIWVIIFCDYKNTTIDTVAGNLLSQIQVSGNIFVHSPRASYRRLLTRIKNIFIKYMQNYFEWIWLSK
jgi:hypothetical protein